MAAFKKDEYESDMSDEAGDEEVLSTWLDEEEPEEEEKPAKPVVVEQPKIDIVRKSKYVVENVDLFYALCEVDDWGFAEFSDQVQEDIMRSLTVRSYLPGENVIVEGDGGGDCYIVSASEETAHYAEVEVVTGNILEGTEVFLTRLQRGQYFGQKYFLTRRAQKRGATCRVPKDAKGPVNVAVLSPEHFDKWDSFRNLLLVKTVPMVQMLPRKERQKILQDLQVRDFKDGDYIIRQGEQGEDFFIIQEGSVKVVENRPSPEFGWNKPYEHTLVTLREGHFFGEMALVTNEPRVASVVSVSKLTICLVLAKKDFRAALSDETFGEVLSEVLAKRKTIRAQRESNAEESTSQIGSPGSRDSLGGSSVGGSSNNSVSSRRNSGRRRTATSPSTPHSGEVSVSTTLSMRKLESGSRVVNKYIVERELGKGSFGDVYLCKDQETGEQYAMKMINRPQSSWNDDASSSIKQEIAVMKRLQHNNIVNLHEVIDDQNARKIFLIQEFMEGGPLMADAETCEPVDISLARKYFRDILRGVCYLHSEGIIHRDIKPQNMLLSADGTVKIADFGAAVFTTANEKVAYGGTPAFMAPELFLTNSTIDFTKNEGIDVFALGATLYFMLCGKPPWMAKNQLDLATKIKNIELTFPTTTIDPHVKHLLRQMLAKDYRTRCTLDAIVSDDWVTFEGSEPLFESVDFSGTSYGEFMGFASRDESAFEDTYYVMILDKSWVNRTMLSQKINNLHHAVCACYEKEDEVLEMMASARSYSVTSNFDYIFVEVRPENKGMETIREIRRLGFHGKIIAVNYGPQEAQEIVNADAADAQVKFPIPVRDVTKILSTDDFEDVQKLQRTNSHSGGVTLEDIDAAITAVGGEDELTTEGDISTRPSLRSSSIDEDAEADADAEAGPDAEAEEIDDNHVHDFQQQSSRLSLSMHNMSGKTELTVSTENGSEDEDDFRDDPNQSRLNIGGAKNLSRKRAFKVVPYSSSADTTSELTPKGGKGFDRHFPAVQPGVKRADSDQLLLVPLATREENRRQRREAAMNKSKLAHQYRVAKNAGDEHAMHSSKSLLNLLGKSKSRRMSRPAKDNVLPGEEDDTVVTERSTKSNKSSKSSKQDKEKDMDEFLSMNAEAVSEKSDSHSLLDSKGGGSNGSSSNSLHRGLSKNKPVRARQEESDDSDTGDIISDSEYDEHEDDDDDDYGILNEPIQHLDDAGLDAVFDAIADSATQTKVSDENTDLAEWNHIMVSRGINASLVAPAENTNLELEIKVGKCESIVSRSYMEDRSYACVNEPGSQQSGCSPLAICAVFDGHNGTYASQMLQDKFAATFTSLFRAAELRPDFRGAHYSNQVVSIFEEASVLIDAELLRADYVRQQNTIKSGIQDVQSFAGSAAVMMAVIPVVQQDLHTSMKQSPRMRVGSLAPDEMTGKVQAFIAHVGDCRAVLCNDGVAVPLSVDHKPALKSEKARIEAAGGWVHNGRVNGSLGVSRSFGDIQFKVFKETPGYINGEESLISSIWGANQQVISRPEVKHFIVEKPFEFVILACDGLWDVFDCQEAVNFVRKRLSVTRSVERTAQELIQKAIKRGTQDNTSVVIVAFHQTEVTLM